jgi:hypothetical protein
VARSRSITAGWRNACISPGSTKIYRRIWSCCCLAFRGLKSWAPSTDCGIDPTDDGLDQSECDVRTPRPPRQSATRRECLKLLFSSWSLSTGCQIRRSHNANAPPITHHANVNGGSGERTHITIVPFPPTVPSERRPQLIRPRVLGPSRLMLQSLVSCAASSVCARDTNCHLSIMWVLVALAQGGVTTSKIVFGPATARVVSPRTASGQVFQHARHRPRLR